MTRPKAAPHSPDVKSKLSVRIHPQIRKKLESQAKLKGTTISRLVEKALAAYTGVRL